MFAASRSVPLAKPTTALLGTAGVLLIGTAALLQSLPPPAPAADPSGTHTSSPCALGRDGFLRGRFFGALSLTIEWSGAGLACDGMQRPNGEGVRLFFAREQPSGGRLSVLIGIDGRPADLVGAERPANVTVIDELTGRFFSAGGPGRCWANITSVTALPRADSGPTGHRIDGLVYCVGALPSLGDRSSLTLSDLHFSGHVSGDDD